MSSLNSIKEKKMNDLHSAEGRLNSSEIIDLEAEIEANEIKKNIHYVTMEEEISEFNKEQNTKMDELKKLLNEDKKNDIQDEYLQNKNGEIERFYQGGIKKINNITIEVLSAEMSEYVNVKNENVIRNIDMIVQICKQLSERTKEHIYAVIGTDGSIHLINDIDTGHYIISKDIIENGDILSFIKDVSGKKEIGANKIERLEDISKSDKNKILQVRENTPLIAE